MGFAALRSVPYGSLGASTPSVVVDGSPAEGTVLCLSHWPGIESPPEFWADLSAEMAFLYVDAGGDRHGPASVVSNNHFDQDGLVGVFALSAPEEAQARRGLLIEVARAGDFGRTGSRVAARISMVIAAYADPERSPLARLPDSSDYEGQTAVLYAELLGRLPELCDHPERFESLWAEEDATLDASEAALASGSVTISEVPALDLAVVSVPEDAPGAGGHRFGGLWLPGLHPMAVNGATERGALLTVRGRRYRFEYRYESWVQFRSRPVRPRVDLAPLAGALSAAESDAGGSVNWTAERVSGLTPALGPAGGSESVLEPSVVRAQVEAHLRGAPAAWDPFRITR
jgi:uncharacterized protein DUF6687